MIPRVPVSPYPGTPAAVPTDMGRNMPQDPPEFPPQDSEQSDLFKAYARRTDPHTSHQAAKAIEGHLPELDGKLYRALYDAGRNGLTSQEITDVTGISRVSVSPRLRPMERRGWIEDSGDTRPGHSNRPGIVWIVKGMRD